MPTTLVQEFPARVQLEIIRPDEAVLIPVTIKTGHVVKQGDVLGRITTGGLYRRRSRTDAVDDGFAADSPVGEVVDASVFKAADVLKDAAGNAIGTVLSVDVVANTVTLTANAANAVAAGVGVIAQDGSQVAQGISDKETDGSADTPISVFIAGLLDESKLRGLDASAKTELGGASVAGGIFKF